MIVPKRKLLLLTLIFCLFLRTISIFPLDNISIPNGADHTSHIFKVWYIANNGWTKWNPYWYAGSPFLGFYPPLSYILAGYMGSVFGYLLSYKLIINLFYVLTPLAFFLFIKEFDMPESQKAIAILIFSLMPVYHYYFADGRGPALVGLFFSLLAWKFLKKCIESKTFNKDFVIASVFLGLSILSHHLIGFFTLVIMFFWAIIYSPKYGSFLKLMKICLLSILISIWWLGPFILESMSSVSKGSGELQMMESDISVERFSGYPFGMSLFYSFQWSEQIILLYLGVVGVLCLFSFIKLNKTTLNFILVLIVITILIVLIRYKRAFFLLPIPIGILASYGIGRFSGKIYNFILIVLIGLLIVSYFSIEVKVVKVETHLDLPKNGRVIVFGNIDSLNRAAGLVIPVSGSEDILGEYPHGATAGKYGDRKINYINKIENPLQMSVDEYSSLLKNGWVNYIVVDKNEKRFIDFFETSNDFRIYKTLGQYVIFEIVPKSTYIEVNGLPVSSEVKKTGDNINIKTKCDLGRIIVKESYSDKWTVSLDNNIVNIDADDYGFMSISSDKVSECEINMRFEEPKLYSMFNIISLLTVVYIVLKIVI